jgi:ABC-2 type transport system permease protein
LAAAVLKPAAEAAAGICAAGGGPPPPEGATVTSKVAVGPAYAAGQLKATRTAANTHALTVIAQFPVAVQTAYAVGTEFSRRSRRAWLRCAGGSPLIALAGKLLPLFALFFALLCLEALILHAGFELPYRGNVPMMVIACARLVAVEPAFGRIAE